jgi:hypothetical protein
MQSAEVPVPHLLDVAKHNLAADVMNAARVHRAIVKVFEKFQVADVLKAYRAGTLPEATDTNACQHHAH